jgi:HAD superfamily hydrolase (TIGR01509 family)
MKASPIIRVRSILFDLDGVLVDSYHYWFRLFNQALDHFGHRPISPRTFRECWGQSTTEDIRIFMPERTLLEVRAYFVRHRDDHARYFRVDPRAKAILQKFHDRDFGLGCVTNSHRAITRSELAATGMDRFFKVILTADDVKNPKPDPEMLLKACRRLRTPPSAAVFIGDTRTDQQAGQSAGCIFISYRFKTNRSIRRLVDLPGLISGIG